jgi:hypothetical protein
MAGILDLVSVDFLTNAWVDWSGFLVAHWGKVHWGKVHFDDQLRHSSKMAATVAILDLVSIDFLTNDWVDWTDFFGASLGVINLPVTIFHFSLTLIFHIS